MIRRRSRVLLLLTAVTVIVAAAVWLSFASSRPSTAEEATLSYLRALESGDRERIEATGTVVPDGALAAFDAATATIEDAEIVRLVETGRTATASVSFRLAGDAHAANLPLSSSDGRWRVETGSLGAVSVDSTIGAFFGIGEAAYAAREDVRLLPARYPVTAAPSELLTGEEHVDVLPGSETALTLEVQLRPEATVSAQALLDEHLEECVDSEPADVAAPEHCGIRIPWGTAFTAVNGIRFRIERLPVLELSPDGFLADGGVLVATLTGTGHDGSPATTTYRTESWSVRGGAAFTADGLELSVW